MTQICTNHLNDIISSFYLERLKRDKPHIFFRRDKHPYRISSSRIVCRFCNWFFMHTKHSLIYFISLYENDSGIHWEVSNWVGCIEVAGGLPLHDRTIANQYRQLSWQTIHLYIVLLKSLKQMKLKIQFNGLNHEHCVRIDIRITPICLRSYYMWAL